MDILFCWRVVTPQSLKSDNWLNRLELLMLCEYDLTVQGGVPYARFLTTNKNIDLINPLDPAFQTTFYLELSLY